MTFYYKIQIKSWCTVFIGKAWMIGFLLIADRDHFFTIDINCGYSRSYKRRFALLFLVKTVFLMVIECLLYLYALRDFDWNPGIGRQIFDRKTKQITGVMHSTKTRAFFLEVSNFLNCLRTKAIIQLQSFINYDREHFCNKY